MEALLDAKRAESAAGRLGDWAPPVYPRPHGLIAWGATVDGWTCGWAPVGRDANHWGVVVADPDMALEAVTYFKDMSFTSFLRRYGDTNLQTGLFIGRRPWKGAVTFHSYAG